MQKSVEEFYNKLVSPEFVKNKKLQLLRDERRLLRVSLLVEEVAEFSEAVRNDKPLEIIDAICDCIYILLGTAIEMGVDIEPFFNEIHRSNMTKTNFIDSSGKILKGKEYSPPNLEQFLPKPQVQEELF